MIEELNYYVYVDYRNDDNTAFYVGKGTLNRTKDYNRNSLHENISKKHGMHRQIVFGPVTNEEACKEEIRLIAELKTRRHQGGANFTDGGEGVARDWSTEERSKISKSWTEERRLAASLRMKQNNPMKNKDISGPVVEKLIKLHTGRKRPQEEIEKCRLAKLGSKNPAYGKPQPEEAKRKNAEANRARALERWAKKEN